MKPEKIIAEFRQLLKNDYTSENHQAQEIYKFFDKQLAEYDLNDFYDAILDDYLLAEYAEKPFLNPLWDQLLDGNQIECHPNVYIKKQTNITSYRLILGFYIIYKIDRFNLESDHSQYYMNLGIKFNSFHCAQLKLFYLGQQHALNPSINLLNEILETAGTCLVHLTPGYLTYAKICWEYSNLDDSLIFNGLIALYIAKKLENQSQSEINNAYFGMPLSIHDIKNIDDMIKAYIESKFISQYQQKNAQENANSVFLSINKSV